MSILKLKDSQGNWISVPTLKGDKGNGIQSAVLNNDYTLTLTFTDGTTYTTPSIRGEKGEQGEPATDMEIHICSASEYDSKTRIPTITSPDDKTFYLVPTEDGTSPDLFTEWVYVNGAWEMFGSASIDLSGYLTDVTVNGTSIVQNGIANVPIASSNQIGAVKVGTGVYVSSSTGSIYIDKASSDNIKTGTNSYKPIVPNNQHESTFYGLAKVSGTDEKNSTLPVGQYTDEAKASIQDMLDVPSNADLDEVEEKVEQNTEDLLKAFPIETASGSIASFEDGADNIPLQSLVVDIEPVQDLHGQESPYPAGGGKNLLPADYTESITLTKTFTFESPLPAGTYTLSFISSDTESVVTSYQVARWKDTSGANAYSSINPSTKSVKFTNDEPCSRIVIYSNKAYNESSGFTTVFTGLMLESGSKTDYAPYENICSISGWTQVDVEQRGVNVWDEEWELGAISSDTGENTPASTIIRTKGFIRIKPLTSYYNYFGNTSGGSNLQARFYDADKNYIGYVNASGYPVIKNATFMTPSNAHYLRFQVQAQYGTTYNHDISINYPSTDHDYHPYTGRSITIDLGQTVYGGKLDVLSGKLTVDKGIYTFDGTEQFALVHNDQIESFDYFRWYSSSFTNMITDWNLYNDAIMSCYPVTNQLIYWYIGGVGKDSVAWTVRGNAGLCIKDTRYSTVNELNEALTGQTLVYKLATPITIHLTPQQVNSLLGVNNIWADTGDTTVEYRADPELYIEKTKPVVNVDDVQINGTSIVENGVANVPIASSSALGAIKVNGRGLGIYGNGDAYVSKSNFSQIKNGTQEYSPIVPANQHQSVFFGLAKSAGDTTQSQSSNTVGNYTDNAKDSIQNMLGITPLIASHETDPFESNHVVGELFIIGGKLYRAKTALTAGEYINEGTNVEVVSVAGVLDSKVDDVQINGTSIVEDGVANVTSENIESALGYVPESPSSVSEKMNTLINIGSNTGYVLTYDSIINELKPYPWSWAPAPVGTTLIPISSNDSAGIYYVVSQLKAAADNSGVASMSVPFEAGQAFLSNIYGVYQNNKTPIVVVQGASPNPIMRYLAINNLWAESLETGISGAEMGYWDGLYHIEIAIGTSTLTIIVEKKG